MSRNQYVSPLTPRERRVWQRRFGELMDARIKVEEDIQMLAHEATAAGAPQAAVAGWLGISPRGAAKQAARGAVIAERRKRP